MPIAILTLKFVIQRFNVLTLQSFMFKNLFNSSIVFIAYFNPLKCALKIYCDFRFLNFICHILFCYWATYNASKVCDDDFQRFYVATTQQLKRLESINLTPIFSHFEETIQGAATIRAYKKQKRFMDELLQRVDKHHQAYYLIIVANRLII